MSDDDDIIIRKKISAALQKPLPSVRVWHLIALAALAFALGAWLV